MYVHVYLCVHVYVSVCEREKMRGGEREREIFYVHMHLSFMSIKFW